MELMDDGTVAMPGKVKEVEVWQILQPRPPEPEAHLGRCGVLSQISARWMDARILNIHYTRHTLAIEKVPTMRR